MEDRFKGYGLVLLSAFLWATNGIFGGILIDGGFSANQITFLRMFGGSMILLISFALFKRDYFKIDRRGLGFTVLFGFVSQAVLNWFYFETLRLTSVSTITVFLYTAPAFVAVMAYFVFGETFDSSKAVALVLTYAGCLLVATGGDWSNLVVNSRGILTGLGAGIAYGMFTILCKFLSGDYRELTVIFYAMVFGWLFFLPFSEIGGILSASWSVELAGAAFLHWLLPTVIGYSVYIKAFTYGIESYKAGIMASSEVVFAAVMSLWIFREPMGVWKIAGILLVLAGASVFAFKQRHERDKTNGLQTEIRKIDS